MNATANGPGAHWARQKAVRLVSPLLLAIAVTAVVRSATSTVVPSPLASSPLASSPVALPPVAQPPLAPAPTSDEWNKAPLLTPRRAVGPRAKSCQVQAVGEWFRVRCIGLTTSAITELGGNSQNVYLHLDAPNDDGLPREGVIVFALQPRDRRVFSFWTLGDGYDGPLTVIAGVIVQAYWQENQPVVLLHDALNQPVRTAQSELRARDAAASATTAKEPKP